MKSISKSFTMQSITESNKRTDYERFKYFLGNNIY
jgi:hypothetical protein